MWKEEAKDFVYHYPGFRLEELKKAMKIYINTPATMNQFWIELSPEYTFQNVTDTPRWLIVTPWRNKEEWGYGPLLPGARVWIGMAPCYLVLGSGLVWPSATCCSGLDWYVPMLPGARFWIGMAPCYLVLGSGLVWPHATWCSGLDWYGPLLPGAGVWIGVAPCYLVLGSGSVWPPATWCSGLDW